MKNFFIFASIALCLLSSCNNDYLAQKTMHISLDEPADVDYLLCYKGRELTIAEQKKTKEEMLNIAERNLSAREAKKELQKLFTKDFNKSAISLNYVSKSEWHEEHCSFYTSHNWTFLQWGIGAIIATIIFCNAIKMIKRRLRNRRPKRRPGELDAGD